MGGKKLGKRYGCVYVGHRHKQKEEKFDKSSGSMPNEPMSNLHLKISQARAKNIVSIKRIIGTLYLMAWKISV